MGFSQHAPKISHLIGTVMLCAVLGFFASCTMRSEMNPAAFTALIQGPHGNAPKANGVDTATITVVLRDYAGSLQPNALVTVAANDPRVVVKAPSPTDASGSTTATLTSTVPGSFVLSFAVTYAGQTFQLTNDLAVTFVQGPPAVVNALLTATPGAITADGATQSAVTLTLTDKAGNPVAGQAVTFSSSDPNAVLSAARTATTSNGAATVSFASTRVGTSTVAAAFDGQTLNQNIALLVGPTAGVTLTATPNALAADNVATSTVVMVVGDAQNHPIANANVVYAASGGNNTLSPASPGTAGSDGKFTFTLSSKTSQTVSVTASANGVAATPIDVTFFAGPPLPANSTFTATPSSIVANTTSVSALSVSMVDAFGNPCANANITFASSDGIASFSANNPRTDAAGHASGTVSSAHATVNRLSASLQGVTLNTNVTFTAGAPNAAQSSLTMSPTTLRANGTASTVVTEHVADKFGNPVGNQNVTISANGAGNKTGLLSGTTDANGQFSTTLRSNIAGVKLLRANVAAGFTNTGAVTFTPTLTPTCTGLPGFPGPPASAANGPIIQNLIADLNGDANNDVLSVAQGNQLVTALGRGNGSLATSSVINLDTFAANGLAMADFNRDGQQDVVLSSAGTSTVALYLGSAGGSLSAHGTQSVCAGAIGVVAADFTGDGNQDIAVVCGNANTVGLYANNGTATFTNYYSGTVPGTPSAFAVATMDSGTTPDLVVTSANSNQVYVLVNAGASFTARPALAVNGWPSGLAVADFNGDSFNDVITINPNGKTLALALGSNTGALAAPSYTTLSAVPSSVVAADFNHDLNVDVGFAGATPFADNALGIDILFGTGSGTFGSPHHTSVNAQSFALAAGGLDADVYPDVVVSTLGPTAQPLFSVGNGNFIAPVSIGVPSLLPSGSVAADFNNDGNVDLLTANLFANTYATYLGNGDGTLRAPMLGAAETGQQFLTAGDYTSDGNLDIIVTGAHMYGYTGVGDGSFNNQTDMCPGCTAFSSAQIGDLNHDAYSDYVVWDNSNLRIYIGAAGPTFTNTITLSGGVVSNDLHFFIDDFNADGNNDIVWFNSSRGILSYAGQGDGTFAAPVVLPFSFLDGGYKGDFKGDGYLDLVVVDTHNTLHVLLNDTTGRFVAFNTYSNIPWGSVSRDGDVGDLNGDSYLDLLISGWRPNAGIIMLLGDGAGNFGPPLSYLGSKDVQFSYAVDVNNDGHTDVIGSAYDGGALNIFLYSACY